MQPSPSRVTMAYLSGSSEQTAHVLQHLGKLLALLRAQSFSYQTSHWQVGGHDAYGNHLLFERLYDSVGIQIDELAEKLVGYLGPDAVSGAPQAASVATHVAGWAEIGCPFHRGLKSEQDCQIAIKMAYEFIKASGQMSLGLDDWLMATANAHETNTYLLQQVMSAGHNEKAKAEPHESHP